MAEADPSVRNEDRIWAWGGAAFIAVLAAVLSSVVFGRIPHVQDSIAQLFQARIFALGRLWVPSPPLREFFDYAHMINDGRWFSQYPPGHSLLLVPGVWLGAPWLINPVLGGVSIAGIYFLALEVSGRSTARLAVVLGCLSPFLVVMAAEFMSHVSGLCLLTFYLVFHLRMSRGHGRRSGMCAGAFLAGAVLVRPYTALAVALPVAVHGLWELRRDRCRLGPILLSWAGVPLGLAIYGLYNWGTTGDPFTPGYIYLYGASHGLGFGKGSWGAPHSLTRGLKAAWDTLTSLNFRLLEWPLSSLWPLLALFAPRGTSSASGSRSDRLRQPGNAGRMWLMAFIPACVLAAYVFYWYHDLCFGPRYLYDVLGPILVLSAAGLGRIGVWLAGALVPRASGRRRAFPLVVLMALLFAYAGFARVPGLFGRSAEAAASPPGSPLRMASYFQRFSQEFWGVSPYLGDQVRAARLDHALVFTRFHEPSYDELLQMRYLWFGSAFARQEADLGKARVVYARDRGAENARLAGMFPGRRVYLYTGTIEQGTLQEVAVGPSSLR